MAEDETTEEIAAADDTAAEVDPDDVDENPDAPDGDVHDDEADPSTGVDPDGDHDEVG